jgi:hypothetical protein
MSDEVGVPVTPQNNFLKLTVGTDESDAADEFNFSGSAIEPDVDIR